MTKPVMLIDCDGVLADLISEICRTHNADCTTCAIPFIPEHVVRWGIHEFVACDRDIYKHFRDPFFWYRIKPYPEARQALYGLREFVRPVVVTTMHSTKACRQARISWLRSYLPFLDDQIVITDKKDSVRGEIILDDAPHNLGGDRGLRLLMDRTWNRDFHEADRVMDWNDVFRHVESHCEGKQT